VLAEGLTDTVAVVAALLQLYVLAPEAVSIAALPAHTVALLTVTTGVELMVTVTTLVFEQPLVVPVTV